MKMLKDILKWQSEHTERMRKLMGVSHNTHLWMSFIKGLFIGILLMCLISCTPKNISPALVEITSNTEGIVNSPVVSLYKDFLIVLA